MHYPMPDDNPHDPLNWSKKWKVCCSLGSRRTASAYLGRPSQHLTFFTGIWYTFMSTTPLLAFNAIYPTMMAEFRVSPSQLSTSAGWAGFALAWGVLLVVPASSYLGRRPMLFYINLFSEWRPSLRHLGADFQSLTSDRHSRLVRQMWKLCLPCLGSQYPR